MPDFVVFSLSLAFKMFSYRHTSTFLYLFFSFCKNWSIFFLSQKKEKRNVICWEWHFINNIQAHIIREHTDFSLKLNMEVFHDVTNANVLSFGHNKMSILGYFEWYSMNRGKHWIQKVPEIAHSKHSHNRHWSSRFASNLAFTIALFVHRNNI